MTTQSSSINHGAYGFSVKLPIAYEEALARVGDALKAEGFGILTTIDVKATMKAKLGIDFEPYTILGACNPTLAHRSLTIEHDLGLLLPCNVVVHAHADGTVVSIVDPIAMLGVVDKPELKAIAQEARERLERVLIALAG